MCGTYRGGVQGEGRQGNFRKRHVGGFGHVMDTWRWQRLRPARLAGYGGCNLPQVLVTGDAVAQQIVFDTAKAVRRDGQPQEFNGTATAGLLPGVADAQAEPQPAAMPRLAVAAMAQASASGKGDMLVVNREGKGSLLSIPSLRKTVENQN